MHEEIILKQYRTGTTVTYFDSMYVDSGLTMYPAYVKVNQNGFPIEHRKFNGEFETFPGTSQSAIWEAETESSYFYSSILAINENIITGHCFNQTYEGILEDSEKAEIERLFLERMSVVFSGSSKTFIFFEDAE